MSLPTKKGPPFQTSTPLNQKNPCSLAAGLLYRDRYFLIPLYFMLLLPQIWLSQISSISYQHIAVIQVTARFLDLTFLFIISVRWINRVKESLLENQLRIFGRLLLSGFAIWLMVFSPIVAYLLNPSGEVQFLFALISIPAILIAFWYFFYFFPVLTGIKSWAEILIQSRSLTQTDRYLPFKVLLPAFAVWGLLSQIIILPAPDLRYRFISWANLCTNGLFWTISTYLGLAYCFIYYGKDRWKQLNLQPKLAQHLDIHSIEAPRKLAALFTPKNSIKVILVTLFLFLANQFRLEHTPPAPTILVNGIEIQENNIQVSLELKDPEFHFRGFNPNSFALAGKEAHLESRLAISPVKVEVKNNSNNLPLTMRVPGNQEQIQLSLLFSTKRRTESLKKLEDLHLWYNAVRIAPLNMKGAEVVEPKNQ